LVAVEVAVEMLLEEPHLVVAAQVELHRQMVSLEQTILVAAVVAVLILALKERGATEALA